MTHFKSYINFYVQVGQIKAGILYSWVLNSVILMIFLCTQKDDRWHSTKCHICSARIYPTSVSVFCKLHCPHFSQLKKTTVDYCDNVTKYTVYKPRFKLLKVIYMLLPICFLKFSPAVLISKQECKSEYILRKLWILFLYRIIYEIEPFFHYLILISKSSEYKIKPYAWSPSNAGNHISLCRFLYKFKTTEFHCISQIFISYFTVLFLINKL